MKHGTGIVILAAGESRRMGSPKALLRWKNQTFLENILTTIRELAVRERIVVLGHEADRILNRVVFPNCTIIENSDYTLGQLSSIQCAVRQCMKLGLNSMILWLVDQPSVRADTVEQLCAETEKHPKQIIIPVYKGKRGHPVVFPDKVFQELLKAPLDVGARYVVNNNRKRILYIDVDDPGVIEDIDTPEEYTAAIESNK